MEKGNLSMRYKQDMPVIKRILLQKKYDISSYWCQLKEIRQYGIKKTFRLIKENKHISNFDYQLGIVAIIKNEAPYLKEWIEFHKLVGVDIFYLYDNESTDNILDVLKPYIKEGLVKYKLVRGNNQQIAVYNDAVSQYKNKVRWLAVLDADEFIVPVETDNILEIINSLNNSFSQILIGWLVYGSNGFKTKPDGLVIENFKYHANSDFLADYKPIFNPRLVINITFPHWADVVGKTVDENGKRVWGYPFITKRYALPSSKNKIRINHYYSKSLKEFLDKSKRGYADYNGSDRLQRTMDNFAEHDQNSVSDTVMDRFYEELHKKLK